jgi:hypothetical protein
MHKSIETMNNLLGSKYSVVATNKNDPIVLAKLPGEKDLAEQSPNMEPDQEEEGEPFSPQPIAKTTDDYLFQVYIGSLTVVGLFVLFRMIQKSR